MAIKKFILLLIILSVLISGCLDSGEDQEEGDSGGPGGTSEEIQTDEETLTPGETITSEEIGTPVETETLEGMETPEETEITGGGAEETSSPGLDNETEDEITENITDEDNGTAQPEGDEPRTYLVRLRNYVFIPSELEINTGDLVVWRNFEDNLFTLTSEEGLFENQRLGYGNTYNYTFNETGSYNFSVSGYPNMQMTITVK